MISTAHLKFIALAISVTGCVHVTDGSHAEITETICLITIGTCDAKDSEGSSGPGSPTAGRRVHDDRDQGFIGKNFCAGSGDSILEGDCS